MNPVIHTTIPSFPPNVAGNKSEILYGIEKAVGRGVYFMSSRNDKFPSLVECPYCQSKFKDKADLSKHINRIHTESGLLEGDRRRW